MAPPSKAAPCSCSPVTFRIMLLLGMKPTSKEEISFISSIGHLIVLDDDCLSAFDIALPIMRKAEEFESEAIKQINSSKILSLSNFYFLSKNNLPVVPQFFPVKNGVLMDRGGKK